MKKVKVIFPDGSIADINESELKSALAAGAKVYTESSVSAKVVKFSDGSELSLDDDAKVEQALAAGGTLVEKKKTNQIPPSSQESSKVFQSGGTLGFSNGQSVPNKVTTNDGVELDVDVPLFTAPNYVGQLQDRIKSGTATTDDINRISVGSKKSSKAVSEYLKSSERGFGYEQFEKSEKNRKQISDALAELNKYYKVDDIQSIINDDEAANKFILSIEKEKVPSLTPEQENYAAARLSYGNDKMPGVPDYFKKKNIYDSISAILKDEQKRNIVRNYYAGKISWDDAITKIARMNNPVLYDQVEEAKTSNIVRNATVGAMPTDIASNIQHVFDWATNADEKRKNRFNSVYGDGEVDANNYLLSVGGELMFKAGETGDDNLKSQLKEKAKVYNPDVLYKYPLLIERNITSELTDYISQVAGAKEGSEGEDFSLKVFGDKGSKFEYARKFFEEGEGKKYIQDEKTKDIANKILVDIIAGRDKIGESAYLDGFSRSFFQPLVDTFKGIGDITGLRGTEDIVSEKIKNYYFPTEASDLKSSVSTVRNIVNTTANVVGQGVVQIASARLGSLSGLTKGAATNLGFWASGALPAYDQAYKESMDFIDNPAGRMLYSSLVATVTAATERLFPERKLIDNIPGVKSIFSKIAEKAGTKDLTSGVYDELTKEATNTIAEYAGKYLENVSKESIEEAATQAFTDLNKVIFGDPNTSVDDIVNNAKDTFIQTIIGTALIGGWGAYGDVRNENNSMYKSQVYNAAIFSDEAEDALKRGLINRVYDKNEYDQKMQIVNTAKAAYTEMQNLEKTTGKKLDEQQRQVYVANRTAEALFQKQADELNDKTKQAGVEDASVTVKSQIESKINNLRTQRNKIFSEDIKFDETLRPVKDDKKFQQRTKEDVINEAVSYAEDIKDENFRNAFVAQPEQSLKEVAQQLHGTTAEADGTNKTFGKRISDLALELYPTKESAGFVGSQDKSNLNNEINSLPISELNKIPKGETHYDTNSLKEDIKTNGIKEPLTLVYYPKDNALRLKEGHHRLSVANELGIKDIPVNVQVDWSGSILDNNEDVKGQEIYHPPKPLDVESYKQRNYEPTNISLSELGFNNDQSVIHTSSGKKQFGIGFAPFRAKNVTTEEEDNAIRSGEDYKTYQSNVEQIAQGLGIPISNNKNTWGGYVDSETGVPVQEVSNVISVDADLSQAKLMAAILGKSAPEQQDSVLVGEYDNNGKGIEHTISVGGFDNAKKALSFLKQNGLEYFTVDKDTGDIIIIDTDNSNPENIGNFISQLKENGYSAEHTVQPINAEFIGSGDYDSIISEQGSKTRQQKGFDIESFIKSANQQYEEIKQKKLKAEEQKKVAEKVRSSKKNKPAKEKSNKYLADKVREGKIDSDVLLSGFPFAKQVWNGAIEVVAKAVEAGAAIVNAIKQGIDYIKESDWYKNLTESQQSQAEENFNSHFEQTSFEEDVNELGITNKDYDDSLDKVAEYLEQNTNGTFEQAAEAGYDYLKQQGYGRLSKNKYINKVLTTIYDTDNTPDSDYYEGMDEKEKEAYDGAFKKGSNAKSSKPSLRERIENIEPSVTGDRTKFSAYQTFKEAGYGGRGITPQGDTTTIASIVDATLNFIHEVNEEEGGDGVRALLDYLGFSKNRRKAVNDMDTADIRTNKHFSLINVLFGYLRNSSPIELGISLQESKQFSRYLKKLSSSIGRTVGQDLNTAKLRNVTDSLLSDNILNSVMSENDIAAMDEFDRELERILDGEEEFTEDELAEPGIIESEEELEKQAKQSEQLEKAMEQAEKVAALKSKPVTDKMSKKIVKQIKIAEEKLRSLLNSINCD